MKEEVPLRSLVFPWSKAAPPSDDIVARILVTATMAWLAGNQVQVRTLENASCYAIGIDWMEREPVETIL